MDAANILALQGKAPIKFSAVRIELPDGVVRLTDGGFVTFGGETYIARDPLYGVLAGIEPISDGVDAQATRLSITVQPSSADAMAALASPLAQDSPVLWYEGTINPVSGQCIGTPDLVFQGELDFGRLSVGPDSWALILECGTEEARQLEPNDQQRLNHAFQTFVWGSGDLGLSYVGQSLDVYWRGTRPRISTLPGGGVSNGGGGGSGSFDQVNRIEAY